MISHEATNLLTITKVLSVNLDRLFYDNSMTFYDNLRVFEKHLDYFFKDFWKLKRKLRDFKSFCNSYQKNLSLGKFAVYKKCLGDHTQNPEVFLCLTSKMLPTPDGSHVPSWHQSLSWWEVNFWFWSYVVYLPSEQP